MTYFYGNKHIIAFELDFYGNKDYWEQGPSSNPYTEGKWLAKRK